jgi:hypothetical protein
MVGRRPLGVGCRAEALGGGRWPGAGSWELLDRWQAKGQVKGHARHSRPNLAAPRRLGVDPTKRQVRDRRHHLDPWFAGFRRWSRVLPLQSLQERRGGRRGRRRLNLDSHRLRDGLAAPRDPASRRRFRGHESDRSTTASNRRRVHPSGSRGPGRSGRVPRRHGPGAVTRGSGGAPDG